MAAADSCRPLEAIDDCKESPCGGAERTAERMHRRRFHWVGYRRHKCQGEHDRLAPGRSRCGGGGGGRAATPQPTLTPTGSRGDAYRFRVADAVGGEVGEELCGLQVWVCVCWGYPAPGSGSGSGSVLWTSGTTAAGLATTWWHGW